MAPWPDGTAEETARAIVVAERAMVAWRKRTHAQGAKLLMAWYHLMLDHADDLAQILTAEQGKPLAEDLSGSREATFPMAPAQAGEETYIFLIRAFVQAGMRRPTLLDVDPSQGPPSQA